MTLIELVYLVMGLGLVAYAVTGGADFGGGAWDLFAFGPRRREHRVAIENSLGPIWEANHVWLIFVIVVMWTVFPLAFAAMSISLHIPISLALLGIVFRGSGFVFRAYGLQPSERRARWGKVFGAASFITPIFLGMILGAVASGDIEVEFDPLRVTSSLLAGWLTPFAILTGLFALALFMMMAAVYLAASTTGEVQEDFRKRGLVMEGVAAALAALVFWRALVEAPALARNLADSAWTWPVQLATAAFAVVTVGSLWTRRFTLARWSVAAQVGLVVIGFGLAMDEHILLDDVSIFLAGPRYEIIVPLLPAIAIGSALLVPSLVYLYRVFTGPRLQP